MLHSISSSITPTQNNCWNIGILLFIDLRKVEKLQIRISLPSGKNDKYVHLEYSDAGFRPSCITYVRIISCFDLLILYCILHELYFCVIKQFN